MRRKYSRKKNRKHVNANKTTVDGIKFQSGLEVYAYRELKKAKLFEKYEEEKFELMEGFAFPGPSYERQTNGKGEYRDRSTSAIRKITYTPDFTGKDYIIETKGRANESFPLRYKLFKKLLVETGDTRPLYKPQTQKEIDETIQTILDERNKTKGNSKA